MCWVQKTPTSAKPTPTIFKACDDALKLMLPDAKTAKVPMLFSRKPNHGFQVPRQWRRGNCVVKIDMHSEDDEDSVAFIDLASGASMINIRCVARPPHYGGTAVVGEKQVMNNQLSTRPSTSLSITKKLPPPVSSHNNRARESACKPDTEIPKAK
ncbi:MAG: hypothetical protein Q9166_003903 [cf. Caloplaca sp. 2 TL-2023]